MIERKGVIMCCEQCKEQEATVSYTLAGRPDGARTWHICEACLEQFAPGESSLSQKSKESGHEFGWTSYSSESN
jgi:protein-arginine kinase activator protein McsA